MPINVDPEDDVPVYTAAEIDAIVAEISPTAPGPAGYSRAEIDAKFAGVYTKAEVDVLFASIPPPPPQGARVLVFDGTVFPNRPNDLVPTIFVGGTAAPADADIKNGDLWVS